MKKEKLQLVFIYLVVILLIAVVLGVIIFFVLNAIKWDKYSKDDNKKVFVERLLAAKEMLRGEKSVQNYLGVGNSYYGLGENALAERTFEEAAGIFKDVVIYSNLANVYKAQKKYKKAEEAYLGIIDFKSNEASAYLNLHGLYKIAWFGQQYGPESILEKGLMEVGDDVNLLNTLAVFYRDSGDKKKAIRYFERSLEVNPDNDVVKRELEELMNQ